MILRETTCSCDDVISLNAMHPRVVGFGVAAVVMAAAVSLGWWLTPPAGPRYTVAKRTTAHHMLVLDVETRDPEDALELTEVITRDDRARYEEILVFFHQPHHRRALRRVQWTRQDGFVEWVYR